MFHRVDKTMYTSGRVLNFTFTNLIKLQANDKQTSCFWACQVLVAERSCRTMNKERQWKDTVLDSRGISRLWSGPLEFSSDQF